MENLLGTMALLRAHTFSTSYSFSSPISSGWRKHFGCDVYALPLTTHEPVFQSHFSMIHITIWPDIKRFLAMFENDSMFPCLDRR